MKHLMIALCAGFMFFVSNAQNQSEETIYKIEEKVYPENAISLVTDSVEPIEHRLAAYKMAFIGEMGYLVTFCFAEDGELKTSWMHIPSDKTFNELRYHWEEDRLFFTLYNTETGEKSGWIKNFSKAD